MKSKRQPSKGDSSLDKRTVTRNVKSQREHVPSSRSRASAGKPLPAVLQAANPSFRSRGKAEWAHSRTEVSSFVGIGASAGGLEAFTELLKFLPIDTGLGFVLVQHLDPTHESVLTELLGRVTAMQVSEVANGEAVLPNH